MTTAVAVLAEARRRGLALTPEPPDRLKVRGPADALAELRERLRAVKPELLALLSSDARRERARDAWAAAFRRLAPLARDHWPTDGMRVTRWLRPGLARDVEAASVATEAAGRAYVEGAAWEGFSAALGRWEALQGEAVRLLARVCHDCGREALVAVVLDDGRRMCRPCLFPSPRGRGGGA